MEKLFKTLSFKSENHGIDDGHTVKFRDKLVDVSLIFFGTLSIPTLIISIMETKVTGWTIDKYFYVFEVAVIISLMLLRKLFAYNVKAIVIVVFLLLSGILSVYVEGKMGSGPAFFLLAVTLASLYFDLRGGLLAIIISSLAYIIIGLLFWREILVYNFDLQDSAVNFSSWFSGILLFILFGGLIIYTVTSINSRLKKDIRLNLEKNKNLKEANERALASQKAKNEFLDNMSHEIRTPLNAIAGYANMLKSGISDSANLQYIDEISLSSDKLLKIINTILDLSALETGSFEAQYDYIECHDFTDDLVSTFKELSKEKDIEFELNLPEERNILLYFDRLRLQIIIGSILDNAVKFTDSGKINFDISYVKSLKQDTIDLSFKVNDSGIGMEQDFLNSALESFSQMDGSISRNHEGLGIGLSLASKLTQRLGGTLNISSKKNEGTEVAINFPELKYKEKPVKKDDPQNIDEEFSEGELVLPEELKVQLFEEANATYVKLMHTQPVKVVEEFGNLLKSLGDKYKVKQISDFGSSILKAINSFDIEKVQELIKIYPQLLKNLQTGK